MKALLYGIALQWKLDIRSKTLLITCYMVPLLFFAIMGGIFTSIMPESKDTLHFPASAQSQLQDRQYPR